jgi:hypothetical protein
MKADYIASVAAANAQEVVSFLFYMIGIVVLSIWLDIRKEKRNATK